MRRLALLALMLPVLCACREEPPLTQLPLDEPLAAGQARAGVITRPEELIGGVTAKGRVGDLKLYNSKVAVVIAQTGFARGYSPYGGTILDADIVRAPGEAGRTRFGEIITSFDLSVLRPQTLEVIQDGRDGGPAIVRASGNLADLPLLSVLLSALFERRDKPLTVQIDYILEPDSSVLEVRHTLYNEATLPEEIALPVLAFIFGDGAQPFLPGYGFDAPDSGRQTDSYGAIAPDVSYLYGRTGAPISFLLSEVGIHVGTTSDAFTLRAHERKTITDLLVIGDGDLSRTQALWRRLTGQSPALPVAGRVSASGGASIAGARVHVTSRAAGVIEGRDYVTMTRADADGRFRFEAPAGPHAITVVTDARVMSDAQPIEIAPDSPEVAVTVGRAGRVRFQLTDPTSRKLPAKLTFVQREGPSRQPPKRFGERAQPGGTFRVVHAIHGEGAIDLPAGPYAVYASRGAEYEIFERTIDVVAGAELTLAAVLERSVETSGWLSTDTHLHSQLSPDSWDLFEEKVSALVTEGLEMPVSTEHEAIADFGPSIRALGLESWMQGVIGSEITTIAYGHFNAFPLVQDFNQPGNGRVDWVKKPPATTFAAIRANPGQPFLQVNHPRLPSIGGYFSAMGFDRDTFVAARTHDWSTDFDGIEVANGCRVDSLEQNDMLDWFAFLNHGLRKVAVGATDNHNAFEDALGYPRTYVRMPTDDPRAATVEQFRKAFFEGRLVVTCGPFLEAKIGAAEIGDLARVEGEAVELSVRVAAPTWMDVDRVEVIVNGTEVARVPAAGEGAERFQGTIRVPVAPGKDAWLIVKVRGDQRHGPWAFGEPSFAFTNPIFLDGDGDGRWEMQKATP